MQDEHEIVSKNKNNRKNVKTTRCERGNKLWMNSRLKNTLAKVVIFPVLLFVKKKKIKNKRLFCFVEGFLSFCTQFFFLVFYFSSVWDEWVNNI